MRSIFNMCCMLILLFFSGKASAQDESPYKTSWRVDAPVIAGGLGLSYLGLRLIKNKDSLTMRQVNSMSKQDVNILDRFIAGSYSERADKISYYPFYASFVMPALMLFNGREGRKAGQILSMYVETMALTATLYTISAGSMNRSRPYVYGSGAAPDKKTAKGARRSFYAGHTAATASATFFAAKVYNDFNPDSKAKPYIWTAAAVIPATVGYFRSKAGMHFLTDNLLGYALGAGAGILVPQLHKKTDRSGLSLVPVITPEYKYATLSLNF